MLHLCGHDHMKAGERARMRALEDRYLAAAAPIAKVSAVRLKKTQKTR
jgi:ssRNA-specific RNase YbeY (16S rRNA maturation enzyme)